MNLKFGFITKGDETLVVKTFFSFQSNIGCIKCIFKTEFTDVDESTSTQNNDNKINIKQNTAGITELSDLGHENAKRRKNSDSNFQKPSEYLMFSCTNLFHSSKRINENLILIKLKTNFQQQILFY